MRKGGILGYDLNEKNCQISYYDETKEEPETMGAAADNFQIPLILGYYRERWVFGLEAKRLASVQEGKTIEISLPGSPVNFLFYLVDFLLNLPAVGWIQNAAGSAKSQLPHSLQGIRYAAQRRIRSLQQADSVVKILRTCVKTCNLGFFIFRNRQFRSSVRRGCQSVSACNLSE